ncbi:MAG: cupin domain-containing protein [Bacteroidales bacterium]|jgi:mannose-6-phosphate isomerase-like protein (cupin superfamily)|nr:cupin domain-containing protein [Bacteroidales bacterium]HOL98323.1 cupin domain-containing protein [Bacteroidales bacterium]HOM35739.1 cupin domain-containing protein [Bacteroidales bacterium]HPD23121.1 cupin domain-containing protein [Bacteroidales bacterium]HRS99050.1 cupin domain-containing protein [Bacteroidales bacterium]
MKITNFATAPLRDNPFNADVRILFTREDIEFLTLKLKPQQNLEVVRINCDAFFYVVNGNPEVIINEEKYKAQINDFIFCPVGSNHCINNPNDDYSLVIVIKLTQKLI